MTFDEFVAEWRKQVREYGGGVSQEACDMAEESWSIAFKAGAASRDAELSKCRNKAIEDCARMAAQGEWKLTIPGKSICAAIRAMKDAK